MDQNHGIGNSLNAKLNAAGASLQRGNNRAATNQLNALLHEVDAQAGKHISPEAVALLKFNTQYLKRWATVVDARRAMAADLLEAEALWGDALAAPRTALDGCLQTLFFHIFRRYLRGLRDRHYREAIKDSEWDKAEQVVWSDLDPEGDPFGTDFERAVAQFDNALKAHLRR